MASTDPIPIRVPIETRDRLEALSRRRGKSAGEVIAELVKAADEEDLLAEIGASFERLAADARTLAAYRAESEEIASLVMSAR